METKEIKDRIKKCEDELAKLRNELEPKIGWKEVFDRNTYYFDKGWGIHSIGCGEGDFPNLPTEASMKKMLTYGKLLALQHKLGAGKFYFFSVKSGEMLITEFSISTDGRIGFKDKATAEQAIEIFRSNRNEQELIDFLK